ncbi:hypothetical protein AXG93_1200s1130 [Marchantia polymorpha subsp. ruderalis]|uniref:Uncharacterized protein n=1 Tax=Marchantia polymorpha subsp. ruderalis TaxID=1480154 RepID=A0A176WLR5_MARPO|nr:hypothetical protein AXG93_1200s1130 [Marchantia polymorpha subsp. ruderalis]
MIRWAREPDMADRGCRTIDRDQQAPKAKGSQGMQMQANARNTTRGKGREGNGMEMEMEMATLLDKSAGQGLGLGGRDGWGGARLKGRRDGCRIIFAASLP